MESKYYKLGNVEENKELGTFQVTGLNINLRKFLMHQPYQVQLCLALAGFTLIISLFLDSRDVGKTAVFYFLTHMACVLCDWNTQ